MDEQTLLKFCDEIYKLNAAQASILRDGPDNIIWTLETKSGKKYVARISKRELGSDIAFEAEWLKVLLADGVPVVPIIETRDKKPFAILPTGKALTVFEFVNGKHLLFGIDQPPPLPAVKSAAEALAKLHNASLRHNVSLPRKRTIFTELERVMEKQKEIEEKVLGGKKFVIEVEKILTWGKNQKFTPVLVHNDYRISNLFFGENDKVAAILDFDWSCVGSAVKDVAHTLVVWSFPDSAEQHWREVFDTFLDNYNRYAEEIIKHDDNLKNWILFSCLSDTATYIVDRLERNEIKLVAGSFMYQKFQYFEKNL
ncbi:MAG: phosphotransferase [Candidatus Paceibacterota bacterium]|jgi:Ser/Thr protein kinase RdoA (MazF antagonist)